jgi:hypothetical protein
MSEGELPPAPAPPAWLQDLPADRSPYDPAARP